MPVTMDGTSRANRTMALVYGSNLVTSADAVADPACPLSNGPLWYASYNNKPLHTPGRVWKNRWSLWQSSDGRAGPAPRNGLDRSCGHGTRASLQQSWPAFA